MRYQTGSKAELERIDKDTLKQLAEFIQRERQIEKERMV